MALIGPSPTIATVSSLVRDNNGERVDEILSEVVQFTDGTILSHLAANSITRPKVKQFLAPRLEELFDELRNTSDPQFVALSWLADECEDLKDPILQLVAPTLKETEDPPVALTVFTRLLAKGKLKKEDVSTETVEAILPYCASQDKHWRLLACVFLKDIGPAFKPVVEQFVKEKIDSKDIAAQNEAYAVIQSVGDVIPEVVILVWSIPADQGQPSDAFFQMLSVLCNTKDHREKIAAQFGKAVTKAADNKNEWAAVVDAKIMAGTTSQTGDVDAAAARLDLLSSSIFERNVDEVTLEGFICTAMLHSVRRRVAANKALLATLCKFVQNSETAYIALSVLLFLAKFPIKPTKDEEKKTKLRIQTMGKSPVDVQPVVANHEHSGKICDHILAANLIEWLSVHAASLSPKSREQIAFLLRELACHQVHERRQNLAIQGAAIIAMYLWVNDKPHFDARMKSVAAATISKLLATVVPQLALTEKVPKTAVIDPLAEQIANENSERQNLDTFESLRALTNLASIDDRRLRTAIATKVWPRLTPALNNEYVPIQRSALELVCNLMTVPVSAEHFIQRTSQSQSLLSLLGQCVIMDDRDGRLAAAGSLAILADWETAPEAIGHNRDCIAGISQALGLYPDDNDMLIRVLTALITMIKGTARQMDDEVVESVIHYGALANLETLVDILDPIKYKEAARMVLKCVQLLARYKLKTGKVL